MKYIYQAMKVKIKQLVLILLDNAIKYTNQGGTIEVTLKKLDNKTARFIIKNTGNGIPPEDISKDFLTGFIVRTNLETEKAEATAWGYLLQSLLLFHIRGTIKQKKRTK